MDLINLLFSFKGRIGRLHYFLTSFVVGVVLIALAFYMLMQFLIFENGRFAAAPDLTILDFTSFGLFVILACAVTGWVSYALMVKRTRDAFGNLTWFWCYVGSGLLMFVPVVAVLGVVYMVGFLFVLWFKPGKADQTEFDPAIFGEASLPDVEMDDSARVPGGKPVVHGIAAMSNEELHARAEQLRMQQAAAARKVRVPKPVAKPASASPAGGFGRRSGAPAFGNR